MPLQKIRNFGIVAHIDAGKTTVSERILFYTGTIHRLGEVHDGRATMDFMKQEQERGITIASAATTCYWREHQLNLIDTPGHVDFMLEVERSLRVLDGVIAVFCAVGGVEPQTETVWNQARKHKVPRIAFINKMDLDGADHENCIKMMNDSLEANAIKFQLPIIKNDNFIGIIDLIEMKALIYDEFKANEIEIPDEMKEDAEKARMEIIEKLAEYDDEMLEKYYVEEPITAEILKRAGRYCVLNSIITPVLFGAAYKNKGVQPLLDAIVDFLPSPFDLGEVVGFDIDDPEKTHGRKPSANPPFSSLAFKIIYDPYVGQQTFVRIYSGKIKTGDTVLNPGKDRNERIGRILRIFAQQREEIVEASAGDIVALIGMKNTTTGDTLCEIERPILLENIIVPRSVISVKATVKTREERDKLAISLKKLSMEDPSFTFHFDEETKEAIISGMGELHLEIILDRLKTEFKVLAKSGEPSIAYRETITKEATADTRYVKQSGGKGHFAHCGIRIEPNPGGGFEFVDHIKGGAIPKEYIPAIKKGMQDAMAEGIYAKFPVVDVRCVLVDGSYHEVDSSEMAFRVVGSLSFKEAFRKGSPLLLEPMMNIEINSPDEHLGDILADLSRRRGKINNMRRFRKGSQKITGLVPLKEMFGFATVLRSLSSGRATFSMEFFQYTHVPSELETKILKELASNK